MSLLITDASAAAQNPEVFTQHNALKGLSKTAKMLYVALVATAEAAAAARGYMASTTHVTFHCPVDIVALSLGRHRSTIFRAVEKLEARGLIEAKSHRTTVPLTALNLTEKQRERLEEQRKKQRAGNRVRAHRRAQQIAQNIPKQHLTELIPEVGETSEGIVVTDGTLWCVRRDPDEGTPARLTPGELHHDGWRDLAGDLRRGRTAH